MPVSLDKRCKVGSEEQAKAGGLLAVLAKRKDMRASAEKVAILSRVLGQIFDSPLLVFVLQGANL